MQFSIVGLSGFHAPFPTRLLPPAWSLSTELAYYFVIGVVTGKSKFLTTAGFFLAMLVAAAMWLRPLSFASSYFSVYGPALVFFTGSMFYHYRASFEKLRLTNPWILVGLANIVLYAAEDLKNYLPLFHYVAVCCLGYIIMCLHLEFPGRKPSPFDQFLADVTYPVFLLHWPIAAAVCYYGFGDYHLGLNVFVPSLLFSLAAGGLIVFAVEMPCKKLRSYFRRRAMS
ncbi:MAG: acyltransferase [Pseudomonadota bacterium]|nr:acyltransferase [Pseudomonadota bacterium]